MKILTLNTHSLIETNYEQKLMHFVAAVTHEQPDIIALQEVNQSVGAPLADKELLAGYVACTNTPLRQDNHAANAARLLRKAGLSYQWTWLPMKLGYGKYDEGMALFTLKTSMEEIDSFCISSFDDYLNWKTRKVLGIRTADGSGWFYTVHMGWWQDEEEPFQSQWKRMEAHLEEKKKTGPVWLLGDFNSPAEVREQGYDCIRHSGWQDTYLLADEKDDGITVAGVIDGWRDQVLSPDTLKGMRIDHIWCSDSVPVRSSNVIFNGQNQPVVSDHFGILIQTD